jgi:hypothetical protein
MQQLRSEAATIRWRSNGDFTCPLVVRVAIGGYLTGGGIWHSQSGESIFAHIPGLLVAFPVAHARRRRSAAHRLRLGGPGALPRAQTPLPAAVRRRPGPGPDWLLPFGQATVARPGRDLTIVTWGATVQKSLVAAEELSAEGCNAEVIDLRTIVPVGPRPRVRSRSIAPAGSSSSTRTRSRPASAPRWPPGWRSTASGPSTPPSPGWRPPTPSSPTSRRWNRPILPQVADIADGRPGPGG